ncbi:hypothetical protein TrCOL_g9001 [Triparma columacea]|uniref:Uncharacterized protein n=1 Tax=Triparma columacea TaxID=722753 RepID=A0A9W7L4A3_9STRA|nr:hypothetical protein TrCOL_g9001 [Triparma columacea]
MPAIWQSLRPPPDKNKALKETPIPKEHLATILPLWDSISGLVTEARKDVEVVAVQMEKSQPTSLACAGATSASLRVGKLVKVSKVRDLPKSLNAVKAAITKANLTWAGIENQKDDKALQDLVPVIESVVGNLTAVQEVLEKINSILNPKPGSLEAQGSSGRGKRRFGRAASKVKVTAALSVKKAPAEDAGDAEAPSDPVGDGVAPAAAEVLDKPQAFSSTGSPKATKVRTRASNVAGQQASIGKVVRKLRDNKVKVDSSTQNEFGSNAIDLLKLERSQPLNEAAVELGEYFSLRAEMRKNPGGFRGSTKSSKELVGIMLSKPRTAGGRNESMAFKKKMGSKWGKLQAGVRGEVDAGGVGGGGGEGGEKKPSTPSGARGGDGKAREREGPLGLPNLKNAKNLRGSLRSTFRNVKNVMGVKSILKPASRDGSGGSRGGDFGGKGGGGGGSIDFDVDSSGNIESGRESGVQSVRSSIRGVASTLGRFSPKRLRPSLPSSAGGGGRERSGRSISFDLDEGEVGGGGGRGEGGGGKKPSTAPQPSLPNIVEPPTTPESRSAVARTVGGESMDKLASSLEALHGEFAMAVPSPSKLDMEAFKAAFHGGEGEGEEGEGKEGEDAKKEEVKEKEKKGKKKKKKKRGITGMFGFKGIKDAVGKGVAMIGSKALRAVTPPKSPFGRSKKRYVMEGKGGGLSDAEILEDALKYWTAVKEGRMLESVADSNHNRKFGIQQAKRSFLSRTKSRRGKEAHESYRMDGAQGSLEWADLNLGLVAFAMTEGVGGEESKRGHGRAAEYLRAAAEEHPHDPSAYVRSGQLQALSDNRVTRARGLENLRRGVELLEGLEARGDPSSFLVEAGASFGALAYENSELKNATRAFDRVLMEGSYYAADEALCTKAQVMLRRGQYEEAAKFYQAMGGDKPPRREGGLRKLYGEGGEGGRGKQVYYYPEFEREEMGGNLGWVRTMRRPETMQGAREAYDMDPRHLSR